MAIIRRDRFINPKLGVFYGIFASAFVATILGAMLSELMGLRGGLVGAIVFAMPLLLVGMIGVASTNLTEGDFFAAGRRTPSIFVGLTLAASTLGGVGFVSLTGVMARQGMDAYVLVLGWISGLVLAAVAVAPYMRKCGAFTLPGYMGLRFESRLLRLLMAVVAAVPCVLIAGAELRLAGDIGTIMTGQPAAGMIIILMLMIAGISALGGMRGANWTATAQGIIALLSICVPATIVSLMISNLPIPQLTHGGLIRSTASIERTQAIPEQVAGLFGFNISGVGLEAITARFLDMFHSVGQAAMPLGILVIASGIAALPMLSQRSGSAPSVYEARKSFGWAVLIAGFMLMTLASIAGFYRAYLVQQVVGVAGDQLPLWFQSLEQMGWVGTNTKSKVVTLDGVLMRRDTALFALPVAAGMPATLVRLSQAGALAMAMCAALAHLVALGAIISDDILGGMGQQTLGPKRRVAMGRVGMGLAAFAIAVVALQVTDPLMTALAGITLAAGSCFPVLLLSILWKRLSRTGAFAGVVAGFATTAALMALSQLELTGLPMILSASFGGPVSFLVAAIVTRVTSGPSRAMLEIVRDMRVPGGEAVYDRRLRIERRGKASPLID